MSRNDEPKDRVLTVRLIDGSIFVEGNTVFNKDKFRVRWDREAGANWDLYHIAFSAPIAFIPKVFPISKVKVTPGRIDLENDNRGTDEGKSTFLPYILYVLKDGEVIPSELVATMSGKTDDMNADEPLQLENEPD